MMMTNLRPCPIRYGRFYDDESGNRKPVMTCGYREVTIEECKECGRYESR